MHQTSELYKQIVSDRFHKVECKLLIDGVEYGENDLVSVETENNLFAEEAPSCGNAVSGTITAKLRTPSAVIRTKAKMELFARATSGDMESEWIPKGVYFLDTREKQKAKNGEDTIIVLDGFDAMLFGEQDYTPSGNWPKSDAEVVSDICWLLGVECAWHPDRNFSISEPIGYSAREILGYIAAMYGGSVTINDSGKLQFIGLRQNSSGQDVIFSQISVGDQLAPITKVVLHKMDGNKFTAGDDSGRTLNVDSPWATQEAANYILETVYGYKYQPFTASNVVIEPAVEIGDVLNFDGTGKCCYQHDTAYGKAMISTMGAMEEKEINHDYKYISSDSRSTSRALSGYGSALSKLEKKQEELSDSFGVRIEEVNSALNVYVKNTDEYKEANTELVSSIENNVSGLNLKVTSVETDVGELQTASAELTTRVSGAETALEMQSQSIDGLQTAQASLGARVDGAEASISLNAQNIDGVASSVATIQADVVNLKGRIDLSGNVSVSDGQLTVLGNLVAAKSFQIGTEDFYIYGNKYTPQQITSTSGTVLVLGTA